MTPAPNWRRYLRFWRSNHASDFDDELEFHIEERVDEYIARGMSADEARRKATARLGDVDAARAECIVLGQVRETRDRRADFFDGLRTDVRFALRSLANAPGWTAVALLTIALGIGATTTVFSVVDALLVRTIPYPNASRVFIVGREMTLGREKLIGSVPFAALRAWRDNARTIEAVVPFIRDAGPLGTDPDAITVTAALIDTNFLAFAGTHPLIGRNFNADEMLPGRPGAILLTEQFWRSHYDGSPDVIGKVVQFEGQPCTIVGIVPASFSIPDFGPRADVLLPLVILPHMYGVNVMVRLKPGVSRGAATGELYAITKRAHVVAPLGMIDPTSMRLRLDRPQDTLKIRQALLMLTGAVALLLLVACTNIAHLLLARGATRQRELAVRYALGARWSRLVRQLVTESVVLAMIGGTLAIFVGWAGLKVLTAVRPADLFALSYVSTSRDIVSVTAVLAILCGLVIGLLAALRTVHRDLGTVLRVGEASTPRTGRRLRAFLVIGEVALSTTLLVGALLLIHTVFDLQRTPLGFNASDLYAVSFQVKATERSAFGALLRERATRIAGAGHVTLATDAPSSNDMALSAFETSTHPATGAQEGTALTFVAPDYFSIMGMPLVAGHTFDEGSLARNEVIISNSLAHQLWPGESAVGHRFRNMVRRPDGSLRPWQTVIGVVPDVVRNLVGDTAEPAVYRPLDDPNGDRIALLIRLSGRDPVAILERFATSLQHGGSKPTIENVREDLDQSMAEPRFIMRILAAFAALGVLLAAIGLFGVISYSVAQRTREIGVRMALGASCSAIAALIVGDGIRLALIGIAVGLLGAVAATRLIQSLLYGVSRIDPFAFSIGAILLLVVSIVACVVPMLRATGVDPAIAVRGE